MINRIDHLSVSAVSKFLENQVDFYKKYVAKVYDDDALSPAFVVGKAIHKAIEKFYYGANMDEATREGLNLINNISDYEIDYGKTGTREKIVNQYSATISKYWDECDQSLDVVATEKKIEGEIAGIKFVAFIDLIYRDAISHKLVVRDHKTVYTYSNPDEENFNYIFQGNVYARLVEKEYGEDIDRVELDEIKKTVNRDGSPQTIRAVYTRQQMLDASPLYDKIVANVWNYVNSEDSIFFPNIRDRFHGAESMRIVSEQEESFKKSRVRHVAVAKERFAPRNITTDIVCEKATPEESIIAKLAEFGIGGVITGVIEGCAVKTYILSPNRGVKMSKIATMGDDLALALSSSAVRVIAPIYGTSTVGIEVSKTVQDFPTAPKTSGTVVPIGQDTHGRDICDDLAKMPHMLIGGQTGSGKSVLIRNIISSTKDSEVEIIDMKGLDFEDMRSKVEIVSEVKEALDVIKILCKEMDDRYKNRDKHKHRLLIIDEYADLVLQTSKEKIFYSDGTSETIDNRKELETNLCRLLQKGRAANISVIISTQRPSADIVAPIIKANCPVKACLRVATAKNSEIILDEVGGEKLIGKGDMLYLGVGMVRPVRIQVYKPIKGTI